MDYSTYIACIARGLVAVERASKRRMAMLHATGKATNIECVLAIPKNQPDLPKVGIEISISLVIKRVFQ